MNLEQGGFGVSTDISGVFGTPKQWGELWKPALSQDRFLGFEAIGWQWIPHLLSEAEQYGYTIIGIHGRTGGVYESNGPMRRIIAEGLNRLIVDAPALINAGANARYILLHVPEIGEVKTLRNIASSGNIPAINRLFIENHIRAGGVGAAKEVAQVLNAEGIATGVMVDLVHLFNAYNHTTSIERQWKLGMPVIQRTIEELSRESPDIKLGIHVPLGTKMDDSLPLEAITPHMWQDLASIIHTRPDTLVIIENQPAGLDAVRTMPGHLPLLRSRNEWIIQRLGANGVLG